MPASVLDWRRHWLKPIFFLALIAMGLFALVYWLDHRAAGQLSINALERYVALDGDYLTDAISQLAPVTIAMFGIVVTVVAIIVQLAAGRYTGVVRMFLRDRVNAMALSFYVVLGVFGIWLSVGLQEGFVPRLALMAGMAGASLGLLLMLPYFGYVFWFLEPTNLVNRICRSAAQTVRRATTCKVGSRLHALQRQTLEAMAELTDIASHSISGKDKIIASRAVDAFRDFTIDYLAAKPRLPDAWFSIGPEIRGNPDFVAMNSESLGDLEARHTWVEWQVLRQYLGIYTEALSHMPDIDYLIAIDSRYIGEAAAERADDALVDLILCFYNSYLRATLNARSVRTAYNVLNQYRLLVEGLLRLGSSRHALDGARFMSYYGHVGYDLHLPFVTETVAYDLSSLCQVAHALGSGEEDGILSHFLELDRPLRAKQQERALLGVRKAQIKLAVYYLSVGEIARATSIATDMKDEPKERIATLRLELERATSKDFWEITDRGRNFEYMPPPQRARLAEYFELLATQAGTA